MQQTTTTYNTSTTFSAEQCLSFELNQIDAWTNLLQKFNIQESRSIWITQSNDYQLALRCEDGLRLFQYSQRYNEWQQLMLFENFCDKNGFNKACYSLQWWKMPRLNKEVLIYRKQSGFSFAEYDATTKILQELAQDLLFPDSDRWYDVQNQLRWGSFYGADMPLGLFTRHMKYGVRFYILNPSGFQKNQRPIWEDTGTNQSIWHVSDSDHFEFADITGTGILNIIRRNDEGLSIYGFKMINEVFTLEQLIKTNLCNKDSGWRPTLDKLWFVRLAKSRSFNLILLQSDGLRVYEYNENEKCFDCLHHDTSMAERFGWRKEHSDSLLFDDINENGHMQMIYTGPRGLTICSFSVEARKWEINLNPDELNIESRYANPLMFIPAGKSPTKTSVLITAQHEKLHCFTIKNKLVQSHMPKDSNESSSHNIESNQQLLQQRLIPPPGESTTPSKIVAFLRDTLDIKPLMSALNTRSGKLDFSFSLIDLSAGLNGLKMKLDLRYQSINQHVSILGVGWNLIEDYIAVDYQNTVDPRAHRYYWVTSHGAIPLLRQGDSQNFRFSTCFDLYVMKTLDEKVLFQGNVVILVRPDNNHDYYTYCIRNNENNSVKKTLIQNIDIENLTPIEADGLIKITDENFQTIIKVIKVATANENYFDMNIIYNSDIQCWQLKTPEGGKRLYGGNATDAIAWTIGWNNWLGIGSNKENQKRYSVRWHLKEIHGLHDEKIVYNYENVLRKTGNQSFTQSIYLKSISDNYNNIVQLNYEKRCLEEYEEPVLNDAEGNILLSPTFGHYLKTLQITTPVNIQTIEFKYELRNNIRLLVALSQFEESVLKFSYLDFNKSTQLNQICLSSGEKLDFTYGSNRIERTFDSYTGEYLVHEQYQIATGSDYILLSEINGQTLNYKTLQTKFPPLTNICLYRAFARQDYFGLIIKRCDNTFALILYHRRSCGQWSSEFQQYCISDLKIQYLNDDDDGLVIVDPQQRIVIINWSCKQQSWQQNILSRPGNVSQNSEIFFATNHQSLIIVYDDVHLWICYRDLNGNWQIKFCKNIPYYFLKTKETLNKFDITSIFYEKIISCFKSQILQCFYNVICLFSWQEENDELKSIVTILMLDSNYNIQLEKTNVINEESFQEILSKPQEQEFIKGDKITCRFMYQKYNNKIRVVFEPQQVSKQFEHKNTKLTRVYQLKNQEITVTIQGVKGCVLYNKDTGEWFTEKVENLQSHDHSLAENLKELFFVDLSKYLPQLNINQVVCGNKKWLFDGYQWQEKTIDNDTFQGNKFVISLGKDYVLRKANKDDSFKLFLQNAKGELTGDCLYDFDVVSLENIYNAYPTYIAYKQRDNQIFVLPFKEKKTLGRAYHLTNGNLTSWSNSQLLVIAQSISEENKTNKLMIYSNPACLESYRIDPVVVRTSFEMGDKHRNTGYYYHVQSAILLNETVVYRKIDTIPGDEKSRHGWIETNYESENGTQRKFFNSKGQEIPAPLENSKPSPLESELLPNPKTSLFIQKTNLEIAQFSNANVLDDEAAYFGFESYEINDSLQWNYQRENLIKNDWSLTGEYCLRLKNENEFLSRSFNPKNQECFYQAACWIRGVDLPKTYDFKAMIKTTQQVTICTLPATLLIQQGEWSYFEININLPEIRNNDALTPLYPTKIQRTERLIIDLLIQPTNAHGLDIDHIRFSPRGHQFYARVYNPITYQVIALLDENGNIKHMFYNQKNQPLAVIDWNKYLKELSVLGSILSHQQLRSQMSIRPMHGFYEDFSKKSFEERWLIGTEKCWRRTPGSLIHTAAKSTNHLRLENSWIDRNSAGVQVQLNLHEIDSKIEIQFHRHLIAIAGRKVIVNGQHCCVVPQNAEYLIVVEGNRLWLWINGQLQIDQGFHSHSVNQNHLSLNFTGHVSLRHLFVFSEPSIDVVYKNILGEELQAIQLENSQSAIVSQTIYDELGRQTRITKPTRITVGNDQTLLAFQDESKLMSTVNEMNKNDESYCYYEIRYADNPLNEKTTLGRPGRLFSVNEIGCLKYYHNTQSSFINLLFPTSSGYAVHECTQPHGTKQISVLDSRGNQVALCVRTKMANDLLTTYEYDEENRLIKVLHPAYHAHLDIATFHQTIPYTQLMKQWQSNEQQLNLQNEFAVKMAYNKNGQLIERITPDICKQILIYSREELLRFAVQHDINGKPCRIIYYQYNQWGELREQGHTTQCIRLEDLQNLANDYEDLPGAVAYLQIANSHSLSNANYRSRLVTTKVNQSHGVWIESSVHTREGKLSSKEIIINNGSSLCHIYRLGYTYIGEQIASINYPILFQNQPLIIVYSRNKQGSITAIGTPNNLERWATFTYTALGQISDETHMSNHFTTHYDYNSCGFLDKIQNSYLEEIINYTEGSYGQAGYFDGTIARTQFKAQWFKYCDSRLLTLNAENLQRRLNTTGQVITLEKAEYYLQSLQNAGFLDRKQRVIKAFLSRDAALYLPRECGGVLAYALAEILNEYFTQDYGHQYCYGNHMELTKAKYITGDTKNLKPLQSSSFEEKYRGKINSEQSQSIWQILLDKIYLWPDNDNGIHLQGKVNTNKWIDYETLKKNLGTYVGYDHLLATVLQQYFARREILTLEKFQKIFRTWLSVNSDTHPKTTDIYLKTANEIWTILSDSGYLYSPNSLCTLFTKDFCQILNNYREFIPEIVGILQEYSSCQMGESACDVEAYSIDENGNHRHYWTGYSRYVLNYKKNNNQIDTIDFKSMSREKPATRFKMVHDSLGNVTRAEHKGINEIIYHSSSNRPITITLEDGRQIMFDYNIQGERVRKSVINRKGEKTKEILYLRDDRGRSLVEKIIDYTEFECYKQQTAYIYGPKGLIGFIRDDQFYSVICDHEGSVRLIVKNQEVVAAYDYLPYGNLIRQYGIPQVQISYRYTGQEWDEEIGLYNYHARLYDPDIGRFYQVDPQEQYASPYKYAGNSPVSMIDPTGEIAFLPILMIGLAIGGAYLGGSAANNSWAPWEWDLSKPSTYLGIIGGGLAGALAPLGFTASASALVDWGLTVEGAIATTTLFGSTGLYLGMGAANHSWVLTEWEWSRPMTWSGGFQGAILGSSILGGVGAWQKCYESLGAADQWRLIIASGTAAPSLSYLAMAGANNSFNLAKWSFTPTTVIAGIGGALGGFLAPVGILATKDFILSLNGAQRITGIGVLGTGVTTVPYVFCSALNNSFNPACWDFTSPQTYEAIIGGILLGISLPGLPKAFEQGIEMSTKFWKTITQRTLMGYRGVAKVVADEYKVNDSNVRYKPTPEGVGGGDQLGPGIYGTDDMEVAEMYARGSGLEQAEMEGVFERDRPAWLDDAEISYEQLADMNASDIATAYSEYSPSANKTEIDEIVDAATRYVTLYDDMYDNGGWKQYGEVMDVHAFDVQDMKTHDFNQPLGFDDVLSPADLADLQRYDFVTASYDDIKSQFKFSLDSQVLQKLTILPHGTSIRVHFATHVIVNASQLPMLMPHLLIQRRHRKRPSKT
ncbi:unnamed protein product [Rotaria magnacalcarata]|uniref:DUF6443 domain-containing protein n=1 Tax=Rotaria magnacalcarata TaxID=392030 RepID=A0A819PDN4_9BILA|nr:unnamed protein product [Rotaria magnacalcarata]CAF4011167.1 unnamed protein product [Rotaria magnacalcarata]